MLKFFRTFELTVVAKLSELSNVEITIVSSLVCAIVGYQVNTFFKH